MTLNINDSTDMSPWLLSENMQEVGNLRLSETLFSQGNGFIGIRGTPEEGWRQAGLTCEGIYLNGCYSKSPIPYGESAYAFATHNDQLLQVPNVKRIEVDVSEAKQVIRHSRLLNMRTGVLQRNKVIETQQGAKCEIQYQRFVSAKEPNLLCIQVRVIALEGEAQVTLLPNSDAQYGSVTEPDDPRAGELSITDTLSEIETSIEAGFACSVHKAKGVNAQVITTCIDTLDHEKSDVPVTLAEKSQHHLNEGDTLTFTRFALFHAGDHVAELKLQQAQDASRISSLTFAQHKEHHVAELAAFWTQAQIEVQLQDDSQALQQGLIFSMFQLFQSAGRNGTSAIAAKGLSGPGYDGHYFWDTEIYVVPFFALTAPDIARSLIMYRYHTLDKAKERARQMSHDDGALFAWRTISGEECSAFFPASTAQYHINAAVAFAIRTYFRSTGDLQFLHDYGTELLVETARLWPQLGHFNQQGDFCIDGVTGPDEYTAVVNNNFYTNYMAKQHLLFAIEAIFLMKDKAVDIETAFGVSEQELALWERIAEKMYLPFDENKQAHPQDDSFFQKKIWDLVNQPKEKMPLLLHYHPLVIYRHQVLKQADVILAMFLGDDDFTEQQKRSNLAYYEPLTTHDSTLSSCIHSMLYAEVGDMKKACDYFGDSARMDLDNLHHNTEYGVHTACMAGAWSCIVFGFLGLRLRTTGLSLSPKLPQGWRSISQVVQYHGASLHIVLDATQLSLTLESAPQEGESLTVYCFEQPLTLSKGEVTCIQLTQSGAA
ncbi:glycoside hydrolase family 65 protein [Alteromonas sp. a30]|uniref:glycoside hydrolase family 65 protein n=1 Tax=Alteromonas sp. a30 TaxID=2730917 RepID=UPI002281071D|nr:glycosyl hydrolase family 65 protein [Alteromonas sp. a30]MCY7294680.1 glycoside hydrolase family 65 protein [Alteromonas sp. a30]